MTSVKGPGTDKGVAAEDARLRYGRDLEGKYMTFRLADEEYGLEILKVREIIGMVEISPVPQTLGFIRGFISLREQFEPVVDLRLKFGMAKSQSTSHSVIIIVHYSKREQSLGILVDAVNEVVDIKADEVEPIPSIGAGRVNTDFVLGIGKKGKRVIFLLDIAKALSTEEIVELERVRASAKE